MPTVHIHVTRRGPIVENRADRLIVDALHESVWEVAKEGRGDLGVRFIRVFKHPTGYYESRTRAERIRPDLARIHDSRTIYGWWLEGIGSRNFPVTRFRGYHSFQVVARNLQPKAHEITERNIDRALRTGV